MANEPYLFYPALVATAVLALALARERDGSQEAPGSRRARLFLFALALPFADALYRSSTGMPIAGSVAEPTYSYRAARENPAAFAMWWFYYLNEWIRDDGIRKRSRRRTLRRSCPSCWFRGPRAACSTRRSASIPPAFAARKSRAKKATAFASSRSASSQTFGPDLARRRKAVARTAAGAVRPRAACSRPVEVVNAGTEAYTLEDNLERMRRDILPLNPDLILSTHGMNGLLALGLKAAGGAKRAGRAPARLRASRPRHADVRARAA